SPRSWLLLAPSPAGHGKVELPHQPVGEGGLGEPGQAHRLVSADDVDAFTGACVQAAAAVAPDDGGGEAAGEYFDGHPGLGSDHQGAGEEAVCADGNQQHGFDVGPDHGAAAGESVRGGTGGGGHHHAVATEGGQSAFVDADGDLDHPFAVDLLHADLVDGPAVGGTAVGAGEGEVQGHALLDLIVAFGGAGNDVGHPVDLGFGEEAHMPEIDTHQWGAAPADHLGGVQDGAVAAQHDGQFHFAVVDLVLVDRGHRVPAQFLGDQFGGVRGGGSAGGGEDEDAAAHAAPPAGPAAIAVVVMASISSSSTLPSRRRCTRYSPFPHGPGNGLATTSRAPRPSSRAAVLTDVTAKACSRGSRTTPPWPRRSLPTSNCGLTMSSRSASWWAARIRAGSTRVREMKDRSPTTSSGGGATSSGSRVRILVRSRAVTRSSVRSDQASWP